MEDMFVKAHTKLALTVKDKQVKQSGLAPEYGSSGTKRTRNESPSTPRKKPNTHVEQPKKPKAGKRQKPVPPVVLSPVVPPVDQVVSELTASATDTHIDDISHTEQGPWQA